MQLLVDLCMWSGQEARQEGFSAEEVAGQNTCQHDPNLTQLTTRYNQHDFEE